MFFKVKPDPILGEEEIFNNEGVSILYKSGYGRLDGLKLLGNQDKHLNYQVGFVILEYLDSVERRTPIYLEVHKDGKEVVIGSFGNLERDIASEELLPLIKERITDHLGKLF